jgi:hypothetical protein
MKTLDLDSQIENISKVCLDRRNFFRQAGMLGFGAAASSLLLTGTKAQAQENTNQIADTTAEILTAFLVAEDLATTFYYNGLIGGVIQDPALAGPGGSARNIQPTGNAGNVNYLQAALIEEIEHANLFREILSGSAARAATDPYVTFYFPTGTFDTLASFLATLNTLENAFIGAYLLLVQEFSAKAALATAGKLSVADAKYSAAQYENFALIAASILGIESEHRVLGRVIGNNNPANNLNYEQLDGLTAIWNGKTSALAALTPFITSTTGPGYSLATVITNYRVVTQGINPTGGQP